MKRWKELQLAGAGLFMLCGSPEPGGTVSWTRSAAGTTGISVTTAQPAVETEPVRTPAERTLNDGGGGDLPVPQPVLDRLKSIFRDVGVPPALVWVAEVESSWNARARSRAGAVGLFQLMPATARDLGLDIDGMDERLHPYRSARAAALYLKHLHGRFGSWPLALAAYNAGSTRVQEALELMDGSAYTDIEAYLPRETRRYVPAVFQAIARRETSKWGDA